MSEAAETPIIETENKPTVKSDQFLKKTEGFLSKLPGNAILTFLSESFVHLGYIMTTLAPKAKTLVTETWNHIKSNPDIVGKISNLPADADVISIGTPIAEGAAIATGIGGVLLGTFFGWQGVKHAPNVLEKVMYLGAKAGVLASYIFAPAYIPLASGISAAVTMLGMRHRK